MRDNGTNSEDRATQPNGSWRLSFAIFQYVTTCTDRDILHVGFFLGQTSGFPSSWKGNGIKPKVKMVLIINKLLSRRKH